MSLPTSTNDVTARKLSSVIDGLWTKIKSTFAKPGDITTAIQALDVSSVGGDGKYISAISETDGKISATATTMDTTPTASSTKAVTSGGVKTALDKKVDVANASLEGQSTTILAQVQSLASSQIHYKRFYTVSDGGSANISDKPTGTTNAGFMLEAYCNRYVSSSDWRYVVLCYVQANRPKIAWIKNGDTSISWQDLNTNTDTKVTQTADNSSTGTGFEVLFSATADNTTRTEASRKSSKLTFQPSTGTLTATKFSGPLTGNVTGNCSGSSGSCTGNAATATKINTSAKIGDTNKPVYVAADGTITAISYTISTSVPSGAVFTDTKVTSAANHYAPETVSGKDKTASASGATAAWSIDVVKGVTLNTDGKGHVTGLSVTSGKIPANPNTDTKVTSAANHYAPETVSGQDKTASASGATAAWSIDVVKGVTLNTDGKGHVTGLSVTSGKIPANPNTDTKVTSAANHYAPTTVSGKDKTASASGATAAWSIDVVKGVTLNTDGKGHVTGLSVTSGKIPANPNTDTKVTSAANHYAPETVSGQDKTASASGATAAWSIDVVKGVTLNTDGKGHVTGLSVTSGKIPGNPNTDTKQRIISSTVKNYLTGVTTPPTSSNQDLTGVANTKVYATDGQLDATKFRVDEKCTLQFNTTTNALDFVFA